MTEIWNVARIQNQKFAISGHLSWTKEYHVVQLLEGKTENVNSLMANIDKDPRVIIWKVFRRKLPTMNLGWNISMCYSFEINTEQYQMITDGELTLEFMFKNMKITYEALKEGWELSEFYKRTVETFLLKFISIQR